MFRFIFVFRMAILCRLSKGVIKRRSRKDGHGATTSARSRAPWHTNIKTRTPASTSPSLDQLYLTKLEDVIDVGPFQPARHVSRYTESTFSQFCQEYLP